MGDIAEVRRLLSEEITPNSTTERGATALHLAAHFGHTDTAALLIDKGASITAVDNYGMTPLHAAADRGHSWTASLLLDKGANIEAINNLRWTPLHNAANNGHTATVTLLLSRGANYNAADKDGRTPVAWARIKEHGDTVTVLQKAANKTSVKKMESPPAKVEATPAVPSAIKSGSLHQTTPATHTSPLSSTSTTRVTAASFDIPPEFICPLSKDIMVDPVMTVSGHSYERSYITEWFKLHATDPLTNKPIVTLLTENRNLKDSIATFNNSLSSVDVIKRDRDAVFQCWIEELYNSHMQKSETMRQMQQSLDLLNGRISHCEVTVINSIPDDLTKRIAALENATDSKARMEAAKLNEIAGISAVDEQLEYIIALQTLLNGMLLACSVISSNMVANQESSLTRTASNAIDFAVQNASFMPGVSLALNLISKSLTAYDDSVKEARVERVTELFRNDALLVSQVTEVVARKMTLHYKEKLAMIGKGNPQSTESIREKVQQVVKRCVTNTAVKSPVNEIAHQHAHATIAAIMEGKIFVSYGDAMIISGEIMNYVIQYMI